MIVEIKGVKIEVDERFATVIENIKVGDKVKVLVKGYGETYNIYPGIVIGFSAFKELPSVEIFYVKGGYGTPELCMASFNDNSEINIVKSGDELPVDSADIMAWFDREKTKKEVEIQDLESKKQYFMRWFGVTANEATTEH